VNIKGESFFDKAIPLFLKKMTSAIIKIIIGLFVWMVLPHLFFQQRKKKKSPYKKFCFIVCTMIGIIIIVWGVIDVFKVLADFIDF
jgi:heme/copper-type cytochrome/quinol oxidase subunit 2